MSNATQNCKFCDKPGLLIFPLRYAAVVGDAAALQSIPGLPSTLGKNVEDVSLTHAKYAPRLLRSGYLYVFIERLFNGASTVSIEGYLVTEQAYLYKFDVKNPPQEIDEFRCGNAPHTTSASCIAIDNVNIVQNMRMMFLPSPMTMAKLNEYKNNAKKYVDAGKLQEFLPADWVKGNQTQAHSLQPPQLLTHVPEWLVRAKNDAARTDPLGQTLNQQMFPAIKATYETNGAGDVINASRLGMMQATLDYQKAAAFVLWDHIGITQELNNYRNAPFASVDEYMHQQDKAGVSNDHLFAVHQELENIKLGIEKGLIDKADAAFEQSQPLSDVNRAQREGMAKTLRQQGRVAEAEAIERDLQRSAKVRQKNLDIRKAEARQHWDKHYAPMLDTADGAKVAAKLAQLNADAKTLGSARQDDHLKWVQSAQLLNAFDAFDPNHEASGFTFASHVDGCLAGMEAHTNSETLLDQWIGASTVERGNLFLRAYGYNQSTALKVVQEVIQQTRQEAEAKAADANWTIAVAADKFGKRLVDTFRKLDSAWDEWAREGPGGKQGNTWQVKGFDKGGEGRFLRWTSNLTRSVFRQGLSKEGGTRTDKALVASLSTLLYGRLGDLTEQLHAQQLLYRIDPEYPIPFEERARPEKGGPVASVARKPELTNLPYDKAVKSPALRIDPELVRESALKAREGVQKSLDHALENAPNSNYHTLRIGMVISGLEAINLALESRRLFKDGKLTGEDYAKLTGAACALIASGYDLLYSAAKVAREQADWLAAAGQLNKYEKKSVRGAGEVTRGGFKLAAGIFGAVAGGIGAYFDWQGALAAKDRNEKVLFAVVGVRGMVGVISMTFGFIAAYSYTGLYLTRLAIKHTGSRTLAALIMTGAQLAQKIMARVALLRWVARFNAAGLALTVVEITYHTGYYFFADKEMLKYCKRSVFRKNRSDDGYLTAEKELQALREAFATESY